MDYSIICSRMIARRIRQQFDILPNEIELELPTKDGMLPFTVTGFQEGSTDKITVKGYVGTIGDIEIMSISPRIIYEI